MHLKIQVAKQDVPYSIFIYIIYISGYVFKRLATVIDTCSRDISKWRGVSNSRREEREPERGAQG